MSSSPANPPTFRTNFAANQYDLYVMVAEQIANKYGAAFNYYIYPSRENPHAEIATDGAICYDVSSLEIVQEFWDLFNALRTKHAPLYNYFWEK